MKRRTTRWLILLGILSASAFVQGIAVRAELQPSTAPSESQSGRVTQTVMNWLHPDARGQQEVNFYARVIALTSMCVLGAWFVIGGIPKRNRGLTVVPPATSERVKVIEGPSFEARSNPVFLQAFPANVPHDNTWLGSIETRNLIEAEAKTNGIEPMTQTAHGFVQQWIVSGDRRSTGATEHLLPQEMSAEMMESPIDRALLTEVEQYARQLLGCSPGLDVLEFRRDDGGGDGSRGCGAQPGGQERTHLER